ncbi:uncharacterized protein LOC107214662 [Parus major]|uniref:uncharacterized protein LOC107214662 n=1 Tax=Parus major TaxID=9157 RepID=UPI00144393BB|nr:uncharacterized protein LOC107214662 [Parus major]XP_033375690.1 uncharacterized protein LOC107214662 [Parus major]XP_033375691.1 uncharacterized protein LOC107214662 [Parus major]XP_033375692.1 uncharacterized protein LOC107214662 [Parus major]XP_033375693.1 uncharacterized protein LOC107214662 [Parus major]XP_033375694.1 uncharacterized protein LOC107214662 [Parus major]
MVNCRKKHCFWAEKGRREEAVEAEAVDCATVPRAPCQPLGQGEGSVPKGKHSSSWEPAELVGTVGSGEPSVSGASVGTSNSLQYLGFFLETQCPQEEKCQAVDRDRSLIPWGTSQSGNKSPKRWKSNLSVQVYLKLRTVPSVSAHPVLPSGCRGTGIPLFYGTDTNGVQQSRAQLQSSVCFLRGCHSQPCLLPPILPACPRDTRLFGLTSGQEKRIRKQSCSLMRAQRRVTSVLSVYRLALLKNNFLKLLIILNCLPNYYKSFLAWDPPRRQRGNCLGGATFSHSHELSPPCLAKFCLPKAKTHVYRFKIFILWTFAALASA